MSTASTSHLLLTRIDHEAKMLNVMRNLFEDGHLTDVILACEGQLIHAHKLILSSVSNYFQTIFQNPMLKSQNNPVILVKDMKMTDLKAIIEFVYSGEVRICGDQLESLVKSAETLDISGLNKIDPNPSNHKASQSPNKSVDSSENNIDSSSESKSTIGSAGKSNSHNFQDNSSPLRKETGTNSKNCDKKVGITNSSVRSTRSRCPLEPSGGNSGTQGSSGGRKGGGGSAQENVSSSKGNNSSVDENKKRELRYVFRTQLKEKLRKADSKSSDLQKKSTNGSLVGEVKTLRDRRSSSICEPISKGKTTTNVNETANGDQTKNDNDCKELTSDRKLSNISKETPKFEKPLEPAKRSKGNVLPEVYPPSVTDDYMRQFVCNKERLSMNLKRDDDVQSMCSVTTRSRRSKLLEESGCDKLLTPPLPSRTVSPTPSNRSGTSTRTKRAVASSKPQADPPKNKQVKKPETVKTQPPASLTSRATRSVRRANSARWKARAAKLKAAVATTRLSAKSRSSRVDWRAWFESQAKLLQNATNKPRVRKEERSKQADKTKNGENSTENNKSTNRPSLNAQPSKPTSVSSMPNPFSRKFQEQEQSQQQPQILNNNQDNSSQYNQPTINPNPIQEFTHDFELEFAPNPKSKRKQNEFTLDSEASKESTSCSQPQATTSSATFTRNLRPKRVKTTSDSSDNPPNTSTANTSGSSLYTTTSISPIPTTSSNNLITSLQPQTSGDTNTGPFRW